MKSIRTTRRFEGVIKQCKLNYDISLQDCLNIAIKAFNKQSRPVEVTKSKLSGKVRNLNGLQTDLTAKELQEVVINHCISELRKTRRRRIPYIQIDEDDYNTLFNSYILHSIDDEEENENTEFNALLKYESLL